MSRRAKRIFQEFSQRELERVQEVLNKAGSMKREYLLGGDNYIYYLVNFDTMQTLKSMERAFKEVIEAEFGTTFKRPYYLVAKLIAGDPRPADYYHITPQRRYIYVKDPGKILRDIDKLFEIWRNKIMKETRRYIKESVKDESEAKRLEDVAKIKIAEALEEKEYIKRNAHKLDLRRTNYPYAKLYPTLLYRLVGQKEFLHTHLRKEVVNILCYEPIEREKSKRKDMEIETFIAEAKNPFEYIYYTEKKEKK